MAYTGTMIDDLMATVERAEQRVQPDGAVVTEPMLVESWFASVQQTTEYDSKLLGVA